MLCRRSSMQVFHVALSACLITTLCCLLADVLLKINFRSDCFYNGNAAPSDSALSPTAVSCLVCGALAFSANFAFLIFKSRSKRGFSLLRVLFSKWQPIYFTIVCTERIVFSALSIRDYIKRDRLGTCVLSFEAENQIFAAVFLWNIINFLMGVLIFCCDLDSNFTPTLRRWLYGFFAMCSMSDAIASYVWGNALATEDQISVGTFQFVLGTQITSCISSQVVISLQLLYVSFRSQNGLAWKYSSLRFQLDTSGAAVQISSTLRTPLLTDEHDFSAPAAALHAPDSPSELRNRPDSSASLLLRLHQRWLSFQNLQLSRSGVFVIPCLQNGGLGVPELSRPLFRLNFLKPLHRLADAYPNWYILANASLMLGSFGLSFLSYYGQGVEILVAVMNFAVFVFAVGYFSSKHHNLDRVAAKHVVLSFRFVFCAVLSLIWLSLFFRLAYLGTISFWIWAGIVAIVPLLFLCLLLDCSPKVSVFVQICISASFCFAFGYLSYAAIKRLSLHDTPDCFMQIGAYTVCSDTVALSVFLQLFLFMAQALICRCCTPGVSGFVNSSAYTVLCFIILVLQAPHVLSCLCYSLTNIQILNSDAIIITEASRPKNAAHEIQVLPEVNP